MSKIRKKRLCFLTRYGLSTTPYGELVLPALARDGWDITIFGPHATSSILQRVLPYKCVNYDLDHDGGFGHFHRELSLLKTLMYSRFGKFDVIYIHSQSLSARAALTFIGPKRGKRLVYHEPDFYDPIDYPIYTRLEKAFCRKVDLYLNNEFHRAYITQSYYGIKCPICIAPPNLPSYWPIPAYSNNLRNRMCDGKSGQFVLMLDTSFGEKRMVPQLFEALAILPPHFRLVMGGAAHRKDDVDTLLKGLKIENRVLRLPRVDLLRLLEHTVNADAGVLLCQNNDLGNFFTAPGKLTEYLISGLPVLATGHTGLENLVLRYGLGESVDATRPEKIAEGILRLERGIREGRYRRESLRHRFLESFAFDHWEPTIAEAFDNLFCSENKQKFSRPHFPWLPDSNSSPQISADERQEGVDCGRA